VEVARPEIFHATRRNAVPDPLALVHPFLTSIVWSVSRAPGDATVFSVPLTFFGWLGNRASSLLSSLTLSSNAVASGLRCVRRATTAEAAAPARRTRSRAVVTHCISSGRRCSPVSPVLLEPPHPTQSVSVRRPAGHPASRPRDGGVESEFSARLRGGCSSGRRGPASIEHYRRLGPHLGCGVTPGMVLAPAASANPWSG